MSDAATVFCNSLLKPQTEDDLLHANQNATQTVKHFFEEFARFNTNYAQDPRTAILPENTCLIVKGPPGCGKHETVDFYMRYFGIAPKHTFSMSLESRNSDFMDTKFNDALNSTKPGSAIVLTDIDTLSTNGKYSPSKKLFAFLDSPGMALHSPGARELRDRSCPENAVAVNSARAKILNKRSTTMKTVELDYNIKDANASVAKKARSAAEYDQTDMMDEDTLVNRRDEVEEDEEFDKDDEEDDDQEATTKKPKKKTAADAERTRFARNTKACISKKGAEPDTLSAVYRMHYIFTTHVPIVLLANDHQHHPLFTELKKLSNCTIVQFRQPPVTAISSRIEQIFLQFNVRTQKPTQRHQHFVSTEIATTACGDMRKAMRMVSIGIHRAINCKESDAVQDQEKVNDIFVTLKRRYIQALFDRQLCAQNDHFTAVSYLALDCPNLSSALQHVAKPRLPMVPYTIYQSFFRLLPYAPPSEALYNRQKRNDLRATNRVCTTMLRATQNSNKSFSFSRIRQKLFVKMQRELKRLKYASGDQTVRHSEPTVEDNEFCVNLMNQFIGDDVNADSEVEIEMDNTLNRAAESICRADFEEIFSWADIVTQEFCCRRSPLLQQTWHDSTVAWAFILRKAGENYPTYGFQKQQTYSAQKQQEKLQIGFVESSKICNGRNSKNTGPCVKNASTCTCRWLTAPSLKGDRGVRLQWFKSSVVERDLYDIKTRAICQSSCERFFFYTNYISSMQQVRKRGAMLVNLQGKTAKKKKKTEKIEK